VQTWLATVDASDYARSWQTAASIFKQAVDEPTCEKAVQGAVETVTAMRDSDGAWRVAGYLVR
jgi:hypothetical protein